MIKINKIKLDFEPRHKIAKTLPAPPHSTSLSGIEMSEFESAFLCGLLKKYEPQKILEVGVAAGGSTAVILQCLEDIEQEYEMYSVDSSEKYYRTNDKPTGFLAESIRENLNFGEHKFFTGNVLPTVIDDIGGEIDFLILDTAHALPGEILDFLTALPYLKDDAVVVLHDVSLHHYAYQNVWFYATGLLLSSITADKMLNFLPESNEIYDSRYANIAAFQINSQTVKNICNVFLALTLRWAYFPTQEHIHAYSDFLLNNYSQDLYSIFIEAAKMNIHSLNNEK